VNAATAKTKNRMLFQLMMKLAPYSSPFAFAPRGSARIGGFDGTGTLGNPGMFTSFETETLRVFMDVREKRP
jgi:hypothetical protein